MGHHSFYTLEQLYHGPKKKPEKKRSLRNEKLKANRATDELRRERLRIRLEKDRARRSTKKNYKRKRKDRQKQKTMRAAPSHSQRLKQGDENELERNLRLDKDVASKQLWLAVE